MIDCVPGIQKESLREEHVCSKKANLPTQKRLFFFFPARKVENGSEYFIFARGLKGSHGTERREKGAPWDSDGCYFFLGSARKKIS